MGRRKARRVAGGHISELHSRPIYHGWFVGLMCGLPAVAMWIAALVVGDHMIQASIAAGLPQEIQAFSLW